ncbi:hypothetical protein CF327_g2102 [Tilletia walkeri]|uniref:Ubiquitin 3 binding protein But2 C-terminal domain-containing protein n=1 Tax=Tilletia walkeri TaxID=117179 RepID=A0A8X7NEE4_9BASI|nr:hypothetical protein CF327_g2102 [Tilletia walkeri]KAE8271382.1 hypothetical protein A4X09_0g979 [Tilletia walkeri]
MRLFNLIAAIALVAATTGAALIPSDLPPSNNSLEIRAAFAKNKCSPYKGTGIISPKAGDTISKYVDFPFIFCSPAGSKSSSVELQVGTQKGDQGFEGGTQYNILVAENVLPNQGSKYLYTTNLQLNDGDEGDHLYVYDIVKNKYGFNIMTRYSVPITVVGGYYY